MNAQLEHGGRILLASLFKTPLEGAHYTIVAGLRPLDTKSSADVKVVQFTNFDRCFNRKLSRVSSGDLVDLSWRETFWLVLTMSK